MNDKRTSIIYYSIFIMLAALFFSRALLSVSMLLFVGAACWHKRQGEQFRRFLSAPVLWGMSLLFLLPLISGLWSADKAQWLDSMRIKLPLFLLPYAFAAPFSLTRKQWQALAGFFILLILGGTGWSIFQYAANPTAVNEGYLSARSLVTPLENDHVRFSWLVSLAVFGCGWMSVQSNADHWKKYGFLASGLWMIAYLHLLAARTGLISFYAGLLILAVWLLLRRLHRGYMLLVLSALLVIPLIAYLTVPTLQNRVRYFRYEWDYIKTGGYLPGSNDGVRLISMRAGWELMKKNPAAGVGFGDIRAESREWYAAAYPGMRESDKIFPSGEWLMYGAGCGIPGFILFTAVMLLPFLDARQRGPGWLIIVTGAVLSFVADIGLEVQFGVFVFAGIVLSGWKWGEPEKN
ncbi:MAG: O-antigen ligase family protein [Chitinophagaceae bacterium]